MRLLILCLFSIMCVYPDDDVNPTVTGVEHPMPVLVEPMQKAERAIEDVVYGNDTDHVLFLGDWWPVPLNNSSILNLTA